MEVYGKSVSQLLVLFFRGKGQGGVTSPVVWEVEYRKHLQMSHVYGMLDLGLRHGLG